jgi:hypothetical protein
MFKNLQWFSVCILLLFVSITVFANNSERSSFSLHGQEGFESEDNEVIVVVYLRRKTLLSDGIIAYMQDDDLLLPFQELMILLEFPITETKTGAKGWFLAENRRFILDEITAQVQSENQRFSLTPHEFKRINGELFVSARSLSKWFPLDFSVDLRRLSIHLFPHEAISREKRLARSKRGFGSIRTFRSVLPRADSAYGFLQIPSTEVDLAVGHSKRSERSLFNTANFRAFGDLLFMSGELGMTMSNDEITRSYLQLKRSDPDGRLFGPLRASELVLGDVGSVSIPLVSSSLSGRGVRLSSRAASFIAEFDRITLEGHLPNNYEVELYRNDILMMAQRSGTAIYRFEDVILLRGENKLRLEFYGPQGQRYTEVQSYYVGPGQLPVGQFRYEISLHDVSRDLLGTQTFSNRNQYDKTTLGGAIMMDYGLTRFLSLTAGFAYVPLNQNDQTLTGNTIRRYTSLGIKTQLLGIGLTLDSAFDDASGSAFGIKGLTRLGEWDMSLNYEQYLNGFASNQTINGTQSRASARLNRSFYLPNQGLNFNLLFSGDYQASDGENNSDSWSFRNQFGVSHRRFSFNNNLQYHPPLNNRKERFQGSTNINLQLTDNSTLRTSLRTAFNYDTADNLLFNNYSVNLSASWLQDYNFNLGYSRNVGDYDANSPGQDFHDDNYSLSFTRKFDMFTLGLILNRNDNQDPQIEDNLTAMTTIAFNTFTDQQTKATKISSDSIARRGGLRVHAYHDKNANNRRDANEPLLDRVRVRFGGQRQPYYTGLKGKSSFVFINSGNWVDVQLDANDLPDPRLYPSTKGNAVLPRPGRVTELALPLRFIADIEGVVSLKLREGNLRPMPNITVQLVRIEKHGKEKVIAERATEFDGLFILTNIPTGKYILRIDPEQARHLGIKHQKTRSILLTKETDLLEHADLVFELGQSK